MVGVDFPVGVAAAGVASTRVPASEVAATRVVAVGVVAGGRAVSFEVYDIRLSSTNFLSSIISL